MRLRHWFSTVLWICLMCVGNSNAQQTLQTVRFDELAELQLTVEKKVLVFLTAEWCRYCKNVEQTSFKEKEILELLNDKFYVVIFDTESKNAITFGGLEYQFKPTGLGTGVHELAEKIGKINGVLNTPTFVIMDASMNIIFQFGGYLTSQQIMNLLIATLSEPTSLISSDL